ncbi:hypothetical protein [Pontibacter beigongshangensis]|uniref:hypothetical protein n=1 Tax=Pontibacter beigongshangensis TaxID=2574733 RepID=UPI001650B934|nr:hypothetical protein [Pontibacter beigongshangensis]
MLPTSQKINFREERDFGQKLNATFHFIRSNFKALFRTVLLYVTPVALVSGILSGLYQARLLKKIGGGYGQESYAELSFFEQVNSLNYYAYLFFTLVSVLMLMLTVHSYMVVYQDEEGRVEPAAVWQHIKVNLVKVIYSGVALAFLTLLGLVLLGFGIYLSIVFSLFVIIMVREELDFIPTVERCFYLMKGNWWATFGFLLMAGLIQSVIGWLPALPAMLIPTLRMFEVPGADSDVLLVFLNAFASVLTVFVYAVSAVAIGFQYYNLVEKKDGIGYMEQADRIGRLQITSSANEGHY